jgi:hypothetical protein
MQLTVLQEGKKYELRQKIRKCGTTKDIWRLFILDTAFSGNETIKR